MSQELIAQRYEAVNKTNHRFVCKTIVKDTKAHNKIRTLLSINDDNLNNPNIVDWFNSQSKLFSSISSDHVVNFIDSYPAGEILDSPSVVVEEPGQTLAELMQDGPLVPLSAQNIVLKILQGVNELHELGYLHLDLRPETVGVNHNASEVKLLTLGNCVEMNTGFMPLTPEAKYAPAECYSPEKSLERSSDVYSIGFLFYELLCGTEAFNQQFVDIVNTNSHDDQRVNWTNWHVSDKDLEPIDEIVSGLDSRLVDCIHKMTCKDASERYSDVMTVVNELNKIIGQGAGLGLTGAYNNNLVSDKKNNNRTWWIVGASLGSVMLIGLIVVSSILLNTEKAPVVNMDELNALTEHTNQQRKVIEVMGWTQEPEVMIADQEYALVLSAYENNDHVSMLNHTQVSSDLYRAFIELNAPITLEMLKDKLDALVEEAEKFGTDNITPVEDLTIEYSDLAELEMRFVEITGAVQEYETGILNNSRVVTVGSTQEEIDKALEICLQFHANCELSWYADELERTESFTPFSIDPHEVTVSEFRDYVLKYRVATFAEINDMSTVVVDRDTDYAVQQSVGLNWLNQYSKDEDNLPVVHVTQSEAGDYCKSIDKRLPTESEWELVAGGYEGHKYPWGGTWDEGEPYWNANLLSQAQSQSGNPNGIHGLVGSVSEWTSTFESGSPYAFIKGTSKFDNNPSNHRVALRRLEPDNYTGEDVGFRCAMDLENWKTDQDRVASSE